MKVIPRDLFNDGNLLTNYGHLYIALEKLNLQDLLINDVEGNSNFKIGYMELSGCTYLQDVRMYTHQGDELMLYRHQNSRETYSLWFEGEDDDYEVFNSNGTLTPTFLDYIGHDNEA